MKNEGDSGLGLLDAGLTSEFGSATELFRNVASDMHLSPDTDLVVLMGSAWSVYWSTISDEVRAECDLVRSAIHEGIPVLGICYGAQLISYASGGDVKRTAFPEIGWTDVHQSGERTPVVGRWMQWHFDTFSVPSGFEMLGTNDAGVQAIRCGRTLGVQFHPEVDCEILRAWISASGAIEIEAAGVVESQLIDETEDEVPRALETIPGFIDWFVEEVARAPVKGGQDN